MQLSKSGPIEGVAKQQNAELAASQEKPPEVKLSLKRRKFADEFLIDFNRVRAYKAAYGVEDDGVARASAGRLLSNGIIRGYVEKRAGELQETLKIKQEMVLRELQRIGFSNIGDFLDFSEDGIKLRDSRDLTRDQFAAVSEVTQVETRNGTNVKFKLHNKVEALSKLGQNLKLFDSDKLDDLKISVAVVNVR